MIACTWKIYSQKVGTYIHMYMPLYVHTCVHTCLCMYIHVYVHASVCTYMQGRRYRGGRGGSSPPSFCCHSIGMLFFSIQNVFCNLNSPPTFEQLPPPLIMCTYMPTYVHTCIRTWLCMYKHAHVHAYICWKEPKR